MRLLQYFFLCVMLFAGVPLSVYSQKPADLKKIGYRFYENKHWKEALLTLSQYQQEKPGDKEVLTRLGICSYQLHDAEKAQQYLEYVLNEDQQSSDPGLYYYLARLFHSKGDFQRGLTFYKFYLKLAPEKHLLRANAVDNIKRCVSAMNIPTNDALALVENLGEQVNTIGDEFAPIPSINYEDRLYFSAARDGCQGGQRNAQGLEDPLAGAWCSDMYFTDLTNNGWDYATELGSLLNTSRHEMALDFNENGKVLYYFRGFTQYSGDIYADTSGKHDEYAVQPPTFKSPFQPEEGDCAPFFFNDTTLIFASRRAGGQGGLDLYITQKNGANWSPPQNLGPSINSPYDETTPFLALNGRTLYFSSNHTGSIGGLDIFKAVFEDKKRAWAPPINLGMGINSPGDDAYFRLSKNGKIAYFSSNRLESLGERDIYLAYFKDEQKDETAVSDPAIFVQVGLVMPQGATQEAAAPSSEIAESILLQALYYDNDQNLLSVENLKTIREVANLAQKYPDLMVMVTAHTDESGPIKFDLYYGIKRAELVGKALKERGVKNARILLRSAGPNYPIAKNVLGQEDNAAGKKLNRRVEITLGTTDRMPVEITIQKPTVSEIMMADGAQFLEEMDEGLAFKVEVASTRQIFANDVLSMFSDILIESTPGTGTYHYTAGLFKKYEDAASLQVELNKQNLPNAIITAYINGIRISKAEANGLVKKFPDLTAFIKG